MAETNLQGQKLGNKGRITRERIVAAAREMIEEPRAEPFSVSAVARRAGLRTSSIYNYFADFTELFMAVIEPVVEQSEEAYVCLIRAYWPDDELEIHCWQFVQAFHTYWKEHTRLLHLRNTIADQYDTRVLLLRIAMARTVIRLLGQQLGAPATRATGPEYDLASVLFTGLERVVTIATDEELKAHHPPSVKPRFEGATLKQQSRLLALAIMDERARKAQPRTGTQ